MGQLLATMAAEGMELNVFHGSSAAHAYAKISHWHQAILLLSGMSRMQVKSNQHTQTVLQKACARASLWQVTLASTASTDSVDGLSLATACCVGSWNMAFLALSDFSRFGSRSFSTGSTSTPLLLCSAVISSLAHLNPSHQLSIRWAASLWLLQQVQEMRSTPDIVTIGAATSVCEKGGQWQMAQQLLGWSNDMTLRLNLIAFNSLISALRAAWPAALVALCKISPDTLSLNSIITGEPWKIALKHLKLMDIWMIQRSNISYNSVLGSLTWIQSLSVMESMRTAAVLKSRVTCNGILDAMGCNSIWQCGAVMFSNMALQRIQPNVVTYGSSIACIATVDAWNLVLEKLKSMSLSCCTWNTVTLTSAICSCRSDQRWPLAVALLVQLLRQQLQPNEFSCSNLMTTTRTWWQSLWCLNWLNQLGSCPLTFNAAAASCALQYQWHLCIDMAALDQLDVASKNALAAVCHQIPGQLAAPLMEALHGAALDTLGRKLCAFDGKTLVSGYVSWLHLILIALMWHFGRHTTFGGSAGELP